MEKYFRKLPGEKYFGHGGFTFFGDALLVKRLERLGSYVTPVALNRR